MIARLARPPRPREADAPADVGPARKRRRLFLAFGGLAIAAFVVGLVWILITGLLARSRLDDARAQLPELRRAITSGDVSRADALIRKIQDETSSAHALTSGPAWWVAADIPVLGSPLHTSRIIASEADRVGRDVLPAVGTVAGRLERTHPVHGAIDLDPLALAAPQLQSASAAAHAAALRVRDVAPSWLPYVSSARHSVATQLAELDDELSGANRAVKIMLPMLGQQRPQRYFIGFLNEAEARGLGGIPGAFAVATVDQGKITFEHFGTDVELSGTRARGLDLGAEFAARYGQDDPTGVIQNSDLSPDFRYAARIWVDMWQAKSGQHVDAAIALDPTALGYLLRATGFAQLPDGTVVNGYNVVALTQEKQYQKYGSNTPAGNAERKSYLVALARAVSGKLVAGTTQPQSLIRELSKASAERRFVMWSADSTVEQKLQAAGWAGALTPTGNAVTGFVVNNGSGGKIDYYLHRSQTYQRMTCAAGGTAVATFTLRNAAPKSGLPSYVTTRLDASSSHAERGSELALVTYYATPGARITSITVNGVRTPVAALSENNMVTATVKVDLQPESSSTVRVTIIEPNRPGSVQVVRQPGVNGLGAATHVPAC